MKKIVKTKVVLILIVFILVLTFFMTKKYYGVSAEGEPVVAMCTISEEYKEWEKLSDEEKENIIAPPMCDSEADKTLEYIGSSQRERMFSIFSLKANYDTIYNPLDSNNENNKYLTTIKNQGTSGNCWAFATVSHLEILAKKKLNLSQSYSPLHIEYTSTRELTGGINEKGYNRKIGDGGDYLMVGSYLANGYGPVLDSDVTIAADNQLASIQNKNIQLDVNNILLDYDNDRDGCSETEINTIKGYIQEHGSVLVSTRIEQVEPYYNSATHGYYYSGSGRSNHAVLVVGWDDTYSVNDFSSNPEYQPEEPGAWIVQNSYGEKWGNNGYYYISYEDVNTCDFYMVVDDVDREFEDNEYIHDNLGFITYLGYVSAADESVGYTTAYAMNVFTKDSNKSEELKEVTFGSNGTGSYKIYYKEGNASDSGVTTMEEIGSGTLEYGGYITHKLDNPVLIGKDVSEFSIAVYYDMEDTTKPIAVSYSKYARYSEITLDPGKSYISFGGYNWKDLAGDEDQAVTIVSIKAFTNNIDYSISLGELTSEKKDDNTLLAKLNINSENVNLSRLDYEIKNEYGITILPSSVNKETDSNGSLTSLQFELDTTNLTNGKYYINIYYNGMFIGSDYFLLFSEVTSSTYTVDHENLVIYVPSGTKIEELENNLNKVSGIVSYQGSFYTSGTVVTGMVIDCYVLVVKGDVTGDGLVKINDAVKICRYIIEKLSLGGNEYFLAADVTGDGTIKINDAVKICRHIIEGVVL